MTIQLLRFYHRGMLGGIFLFTALTYQPIVSIDGVPFSESPAWVPVKTPFTVELVLMDSVSGRKVTDPMKIHNQWMDTFLVREDLTEPVLLEWDWKSDQESFVLSPTQTKNLISKAGNTFGFGRFRNSDQNIHSFLFQFFAPGTASSIPIKEDLKSSDGSIQKFFPIHNEKGNPVEELRMTMTPNLDPTFAHASQIRFTFQLEVKFGDTFAPWVGLENIQNEGALLYLMSVDGSTVYQKQLIRLSQRIGRGKSRSHLVFTLKDGSILGNELFRAWLVLRAYGRNHFFPFTFRHHVD